MSVDQRVQPARPDLASSRLEGLVRADRYAEALTRQTIVPIAAIRIDPARSAEQVDQLLFGERFDLFEVRGDYGWGQAHRDGYVGWVETAALSAALFEATHWICAPASFAFAEPSIKSPATGPFSLNSLVSIDQTTATMAQVNGAGWIARTHLAPIGFDCLDPVDVALRCLGAPYLWGGRAAAGLDCSGLVQQALYAAGVACPRDADQQAELGAATTREALRRGDLVAWPGHIGLMLDAWRLLHANAHHMAVAIEPLDEAIVRIKGNGGGEPTHYRRLTTPPIARTPRRRRRKP